MTGDFSFTKNWDYPEGVYKNEIGQLSCDGQCPQEVDRMKDENGKIYEDSLTAFINWLTLLTNFIQFNLTLGHMNGQGQIL